MSKFNIVLALDTAMNGCGACVYRDSDGVAVTKAMPMPRGQAEHLVPLIESVLAEAGVAYEELDGVVTTVGPGAFTGLRIGISTARSLALALDIPVYGITTLQVFALQYVQEHDFEGQLAVLIETKRDDFYVQRFDSAGKALDEACALPAEDVARYLGEAPGVVIGDAIERFQDVLGDEASKGSYESAYELPDTLVMAQALVQGVSEIIHENPVPVYLRDADVSKSRKPQRVLVK